MIDGAPPRLLRTHVGHRPRDSCFSCGRHGSELRDAEVEQLRRALFRDEDIRRLDVSMNDPFLVRGAERMGDLLDHVERVASRQWTAFVLPLERLAFVVRHHDEEQAAVRLTNVMDDSDVRVVERRSRFGFGDETFLGARIAAQGAGKNFRATNRSRRWSRALKTTPIPPAASLSRIRYWANIWPTTSS